MSITLTTLLLIQPCSTCRGIVRSWRRGALRRRTFHRAQRTAAKAVGAVEQRDRAGAVRPSVDDRDRRSEVRILDSFGLPPNTNECGTVYGVAAGSTPMSYPPLAWQTYDVDFTAAAYDGGKKVKNSRMTVRHNGVEVLKDVEVPPATTAAPLPGRPRAGTGLSPEPRQSRPLPQYLGHQTSGLTPSRSTPRANQHHVNGGHFFDGEHRRLPGRARFGDCRRRACARAPASIRQTPRAPQASSARKLSRRQREPSERLHGRRTRGSANAQGLPVGSLRSPLPRPPAPPPRQMPTACPWDDYAWSYSPPPNPPSPKSPRPVRRIVTLLAQRGRISEQQT